MKWISHQIIALSITYSITEAPVPSLIASVSSTFPDAIESGFGRFFFRKHRGLSHNPILQVIIIIFLYHLLIKKLPEIPTSLSNLISIDSTTVFTAISAGIFIHLFTDSLSSSGIPLWKTRRIALGLYKTNTFSEFAVVMGIFLTCIAFYALKELFTWAS